MWVVRLFVWVLIAVVGYVAVHEDVSAGVYAVGFCVGVAACLIDDMIKTAVEKRL